MKQHRNYICYWYILKELQRDIESSLEPLNSHVSLCACAQGFFGLTPPTNHSSCG